MMFDTMCVIAVEEREREAISNIRKNCSSVDAGRMVRGAVPKLRSAQRHLVSLVALRVGFFVLLVFRTWRCRSSEGGRESTDSFASTFIAAAIYHATPITKTEAGKLE